MKKFLLFVLTLIFGVTLLTGCGKTTAKPTTKSSSTDEKVADTRPTYCFIIYEKDSDNNNLNDNKVVASYLIHYSTGDKVSDTLIKGSGNKYYFVEGGTDYLVLKNSQYGLSYDKGYFENYSGCANNTEIDVSWSMTLGNGESLMTGIGSTSVEDLAQYGFVIDGWR